MLLIIDNRGALLIAQFALQFATGGWDTLESLPVPCDLAGVEPAEISSFAERVSSSLGNLLLTCAL